MDLLKLGLKSNRIESKNFKVIVDLLVFHESKEDIPNKQSILDA